jgi:hypothetical protein
MSCFLSSPDHRWYSLQLDETWGAGNRQKWPTPQSTQCCFCRGEGGFCSLWRESWVCLCLYLKIALNSWFGRRYVWGPLQYCVIWNWKRCSDVTKSWWDMATWNECSDWQW